MSHPHRLTSAQDCLGRGFEQDAPEPDRTGQTGRGPGGEPTSLAQQLLYSCDQLANNRSILGAGRVEIARCSVIVLRIGRHWRSDLELVYLLMPAFVVRQSRLSRLAFIVDDENSRSASNVGGDSRQEPEGSTRSGEPVWRPGNVSRHGYGGYDTV
jgi:hypothetical protein